MADDDAEDNEDDEQDEDAVTLSQVEFKELQDQQLMHADYTKKTQALATDRKQTEALNSDLAGFITEFESLIVNEASEAELNELLEDGDTAEYLRKTNEIKANKGKLKAIKAKQAEAFKATQTAENGKLIDQMKEWADPKTGAATQKSDVDTALSYATEVGFTNDDLEKLADHKVIRALIDAGKYRALKKSKPFVNKRKTPAAKKASKKPSQDSGKNILSEAEKFYAKKG